MRNYIYLGVLFFLIRAFSLEALSLRLENETTYPLVARVFGADGSLLGEETVNPKSLVQWSESQERGNHPPQGPSVSLVPMTVRWFCSEGELFGISESEVSGARVRTSACSGNKFCKEKKKDAK